MARTKVDQANLDAVLDNFFNPQPRPTYLDGPKRAFSGPMAIPVQYSKFVLIPDLAERLVEDNWPEFTVELATRELALAGWNKYGAYAWKSPSGNIYRGPALAWKVMRKLSSQC